MTYTTNHFQLSCSHVFIFSNFWASCPWDFKVQSPPENKAISYWVVFFFIITEKKCPHDLVACDSLPSLLALCVTILLFLRWKSGGSTKGGGKRWMEFFSGRKNRIFPPSEKMDGSPEGETKNRIEVFCWISISLFELVEFLCRANPRFVDSHFAIFKGSMFNKRIRPDCTICFSQAHKVNGSFWFF